MRASGPLEQMTWKSINCAFTRLYLSLGPERVLKMAHDMGVKGDLEPFVSFAAGGNAISPADMAGAFETIANNGLHHDPYYIEKIERADGTVLYQHQDPGTQVLTPEVADRTIDILRGVLISGTGRRGKLADNRPAAGKTGTQENNTNAWFVGGTPQYTTAVWMGNPNENKDQMVNVKEFKAFSHVQGGTYPVLIWKAYMDAAHEGLAAEDWPKPPSNPRKAATIYLPGTDCLYKAVPVTTPPSVDGAAPDPNAPTSTPTPSFNVQVVRSTTTTTIAGAQIDLKAPAPSIAGAYSVYACSAGGRRFRGHGLRTTTAGAHRRAPPATEAAGCRRIAADERPGEALVVRGHDTRSDQLRHRRAALPERSALGVIEKVIADLDGEARAASVERDGLAAKQERMEVELTADLRKAAELDRRLSQTVVPREAEAFQAEARVVAAHRSHLEDDIFALMETIEPIEIRLAEIAAQRGELDGRPGGP